MRSKDQRLRHYIKIRPDEQFQSEFAAFHIHVDSQALLPEEVTEQLLKIGHTYDLFEPDWHFYGLGGDLTRAFPHFAPAQHMTFVTSSSAKYHEVWKRTVSIIEETSTPCYIEGELIVLDSPLPAKSFDLEAYNEIAPEAAGSGSQFGTFRSARAQKAERVLPARVKLRRLDPEKNGRKDRFRKGEMHLTLRDDTHPLLLELLCNLGFSTPAIPKLVESEDGRLERNPDGSFRKILDIPLTMQTTDMRMLMKFANLTTTIVESIGGVSDGSIKIEFATNFAVLNGVDYNSCIPPVLDCVEYRDDFEDISHDHLGSIPANLAELTKMTRKRVRSAEHIDRMKRFEEIWDNTDKVA